MTNHDGLAWSAEFATLVGRLSPRFGRAEPRRRLAACLCGLLAPVERKNGWPRQPAAGRGAGVPEPSALECRCGPG